MRFLIPAFYLMFSVCVFFIAKFLFKKLHITSAPLRIIILSAAVLIYCVAMMFYIPFSPCYDSYDMLSFLEKMLLGTNTEYMNAYMSAYSSNRLTTYIYFPFVLIFNNVQIGVRSLNFLLAYGSILLLAACCKKMFGQICCEISLCMSVLLFPFMLFVGPYIYLPAVFLSALTLFLYHCSSLSAKICFYIAGGFLFALRPMSCLSILICIFAKNLFCGNVKCKFLSSVGKVSFTLACFLIVKSSIGFVLFTANLHPYPNLSDTSFLWTLEVGTRPNGPATGQCIYFPYTNDGFDDISAQFSELWKCFSSKNSKSDYINSLKNDIFKKIVNRTKNTVLANPGSALHFLCTKYINYYSDVHRPYYYMPNISMSNFGNAVSQNFEKRFFLFMNTYLILFNISALLLFLSSAVRLIKRKKPLTLRLFTAAALSLSALAVSMTAIALTEVGKRLMFDTYAVTLPVICCFTCRLCIRAAMYAKNKKRINAMMFAGAVLSATSALYAYSSFNIPIMRGVCVSFTDDSVKIEFLKTVTDSSYSILYDGEYIPLCGQTEIRLPNAKNSDCFFYICLPNGSLYQISKLRQI